MIIFPLTLLLRLCKSLVNVSCQQSKICFVYVVLNWSLCLIYIFYFVLLFKIEEEERQLEAAIEETEKQCAEVTAELKELELKSSRFKELEEK